VGAAVSDGDEPNSRQTVTLGALFLAFAKIGLCGISSLLAWTRRVIVDEKHWMNEAEFAETLSVCLFLPGPENANIAIYVGSKFRGSVGAIVALLGLTLAPLAIGLVLGTLYLRYPHLAIIQKILGGLSAAAAGLLIGTGIQMLLPHRSRPTALFFAALAFVGIIFAKLPLLVVLLGLVPLSIAVAAFKGLRTE
jgi:chromate transporter